MAPWSRFASSLKANVAYLPEPGEISDVEHDTP
jgi:hypothetical protein